MDVQKLIFASLLLNIYFGVRFFKEDRKETIVQSERDSNKDLDRKWRYRLAASENKKQSIQSRLDRLEAKLEMCVKREDRIQERLSATRRELETKEVPIVKESYEKETEEYLMLRQERWASSLEKLFLEELEMGQEDLDSYFSLKSGYDLDVHGFWNDLSDTRSGKDLVVPNYLENREFSRIEDRFYEGLLELMGPEGFEKFLDHQQKFNNGESKAQAYKGFTQ